MGGTRALLYKIAVLNAVRNFYRLNVSVFSESISFIFGLTESFLNKFRKQLSYRQLEIHVFINFNVLDQAQSSTERDQSLSINHLTVHATFSITISFITLLSDQERRQKGNGRGEKQRRGKSPTPQNPDFHYFISNLSICQSTRLITTASYQKHITLVGNRSSRPKVILSETRVMSTEIFSQVTQNFNKECM